MKIIRKDVVGGRWQVYSLLWEKAYQEVIETLGHSKNDDDGTPRKAKYKPNLGLVYEGFD